MWLKRGRFERSLVLVTSHAGLAVSGQDNGLCKLSATNESTYSLYRKWVGRVALRRRLRLAN